MMKLKKLRLAAVVVVAGFLLAGCAGGRPTASGESSSGAVESLRIGVMPAVDAAPFFIAEANGYFRALGLNVDIQVFTNATDRQSALQSGAIDGAITDVIALVNNVGNGFSMKVTTCTDGMFPFLVRSDFSEKKAVKAGMMEVSVTNYLSDRALGAKYTLEKVYINDIPARLEMVSKGTLDMAVIPEPMASQGELNGLKKEVYPTGDAYSPDVLVFTGKALQGKEKAIRLFHQAYNKAVAAINHDDSQARSLLIEKLKLNEAIRDKILMPTYKTATVPDEAYLNSILAWNKTVLKQDVQAKYADLVDTRFTKE